MLAEILPEGTVFIFFLYIKSNHRQVSYSHHIKVPIFKLPPYKLTDVNKAVLQVRCVHSTHHQPIVKTTRQAFSSHPWSIPHGVNMFTTSVLNFGLFCEYG